jgi:hypothetical protein
VTTRRRAARSSSSLPTTGKGGVCSKTTICEKNPPVKWRFMNGLENRGCESDRDKLRNQLSAEVVDEGSDEGPLYVSAKRTQFISIKNNGLCV